uniref:Peroxisomal membrane protein PEX14-like KPWE domain-containing protein n=1 Tax=Meleagris gallopavo TaxID=9103 RepID=A0A803Y6P9_MELGA
GSVLPPPCCSATLTPATPSSFAELLQMVQRGQVPAGVRCPNASPTNDSPTASRLPRPPKPWESRPDRTRRAPRALAGFPVLPQACTAPGSPKDLLASFPFSTRSAQRNWERSSVWWCRYQSSITSSYSSTSTSH